MDYTRESSPEKAVLTLSGDLSVRCAGATREVFAALAEEPRPLEIRFGTVTHSDVSLAQLICAIHRLREAAHVRTTLGGKVPDGIRGLLHDMTQCQFGIQIGTECLWKGYESYG